MGILICIFVMALIIVLGRYALSEGRRIESQKRFMKNMNDYGKNKNKK
jgi:hypothetical protein